MKYLFVLAFLILSQSLSAQLPEDALRLSWTAPSGTARQQAIGGAMGSLGGEISSVFVNPAGLGLYKTREVVFSPGFRFQTDKSDYRGTNSSGSSANNFNIGSSGLVYGFLNRGGNSGAFSIAVNRTANFNSNTYYRGQNDYSSSAEQYSEDFAYLRSNFGYTIDDALNDPSVSYGTRMGLYTYLVDTVTIGGSTQIVAQPQKILSAGGSLDQVYNNQTRGGITEIALSFAGNLRDKWLFGGSLGLPIVSYTRDLTFTETDATGNNNNDFASFTYKEHYTTRGAGFNIKLGTIYKPANAWRVGLAVHTPSWYALKDRITASMVTNTENYAHERSVTSAELDNNQGGQVRYDFTSPWKFIVSGSYIFGGEAMDVKQQKGFITGDIEYVTTRGPRYSAPQNPDGSSGDDSYFDGVNSVIKSYYKNTFNFRLGGELKFNTLAVRLGGAYYTNPYKDSELKADRLFVSGGIGYRHKGIFVDLTYVQGFTKDVNFPYRLTDKSNTFATVKQNTGTALLTFGVKF